MRLKGAAAWAALVLAACCANAQDIRNLPTPSTNQFDPNIPYNDPLNNPFLSTANPFPRDPNYNNNQFGQSNKFGPNYGYDQDRPNLWNQNEYDRNRYNQESSIIKEA